MVSSRRGHDASETANQTENTANSTASEDGARKGQSAKLPLEIARTDSN